MSKPSSLSARAPLLLILVILILAPGILWKAFSLTKPTADVQPVSMTAVQARIAASRGQPTVVYVYASWCPACQTAIPDLNRVVRRYADRGVAFTVVSIDEDIDALQTLLDDTGVEFDPLVVPAAPEGAVSSLLEGLGANPAGAIPYGLVLDPAGQVHREWTGWRSLDAWKGTLDEVL